MASRYTQAQAAVVDSDNRNMASNVVGIDPMSAEIDAIWNAIDNGPIGLQSASADIDALCLGGGAFTYNPNASAGMTFAYNAGRFHNLFQEITVSAGTLTLAASSTNFVEVNAAGVVSSNTSGFTAGRMPLMTVVTSTSGVSSVANNRPVLTFAGPAGVNGTLLSATAATKSMDKSISSIAATTEFLFIMPATGVIKGISIVNSSAVAANNTNSWAFSAINKGAAGTGTAPVLDTGADNSTLLTGGSGLTAYASRNLVLNGTPTNLNVNAGDTVAVSVTATGAPTTLTEFALRIDIGFTS